MVGRRTLMAGALASIAAGSTLLSQTQAAWTLPYESAGDPWLRRVGASTGIRTHALALVTVAGGTVREAFWRCRADTVFEIGSVSKALTGLVIADAVGRGDVGLAERLGALLPLGSTPASGVTLKEAATHTSGLPRGVTRRNGMSWSVPYQRVGVQVLCEDAKAVMVLGERTFSYSNLGASLAGWATAGAVGTTYPHLMATRLFGPLGMTASAAQYDRPIAPPGHSGIGRPVPQLVADGYAPMGGLVSTAADLRRLLLALVERRAPGMTALDGLVPSGAGREGLLWDVQPYDRGLWASHPGGTPGYAAYLGVDVAGGRGLAVLADQAGAGVEELGKRILAQLP